MLLYKSHAKLHHIRSITSPIGENNQSRREEIDLSHPLHQPGRTCLQQSDRSRDIWSNQDEMYHQGLWRIDLSEVRHTFDMYGDLYLNLFLTCFCLCHLFPAIFSSLCGCLLMVCWPEVLLSEVRVSLHYCSHDSYWKGRPASRSSNLWLNSSKDPFCWRLTHYMYCTRARSSMIRSWFR